MKTITTDNNAEASIFKETDLTEINRRVDMIKQRLIGDLLSASGNPLTLNGIFNYLSVLIQLPIMVLLYEKRKDKYHYKEHFDFEKTKASRGSLALHVQGADGKFVEFDLSAHGVIDGENQLFQIFETGFFIKVFMLEVGGGDVTPFTELSSIQEKRESELTNFQIQQEYARLCAKSVFSLSDSKDIALYGQAFILDVNEKMEAIFTTKYAYAKLSEADRKKRRKLTLVDSEKIEYIKKFVEDRNQDIKGNLHSLDRLYRRASDASLAIKKIGADGHQELVSAGGDIPNLLFFLRAYDRETPRSERALANGEKFRGYAHNVSFLIPEKQEKEIQDCFKFLRAQAKVGVPYDGERYGHGWTFENPDYASFSASLDKEFWFLLKKEESSQEKDGIKTILEILNKAIGADTTSMVDAVFYYGTSMYRLPFRREGGLGRLYALTSHYKKLSKKQKKDFTFNSLDPIKDKELRDDCLRVVIFFYVSRMLAPFCQNQEKKWTKVHLFPIDVSGSVVGAVGSISYEQKIETSTEKVLLDQVTLPIDAATWNQDFYFFAEIFSSVQRALRQQFRDFQINQLCKVASKELKLLIYEASCNTEQLVSNESLQRFAVNMNDESKKIARICPYPAYEFTIVDTSMSDDLDSDMHKNTVFMGAVLGLKFERNQNFDIFRSLYGVHQSKDTDKQSKDYLLIDNVFKENAQSLKTKLQERVTITLETAAKLSVRDESDGVNE